MTEDKPAIVQVNSLRSEVIDRLTDQFASDAMSLEDFESNLDLANQANTLAELQALMQALGRKTPTAPRRSPMEPGGSRPPARAAASELVPERSLIFGFWGGASRGGAWTPARKNYVIAFQGGAELDLRDALFGPGITEVIVFCCMGGVNVIVPPDLQVDFGGLGIMGGFEAEETMAPLTDPDAPVVRIRGVAFWGGAGVEVRNRGETAAQARQRRRLAGKMGRELPPNV